MLWLRGFNRTKVGLKLVKEAFDLAKMAGFNRTKVGLKLAIGEGMLPIIEVLIEPKWD